MKVAIVGCGAVSQLYYAPALEALASKADISVTALFDPSLLRAKALAKSFPEAMLVDRIEQLAPLGVELAIVASPPVFHSQQCIKLLADGVSVLCEKPMATSVADAEQMVAQAAESGKILAIGLVRRFFPALTECKHIIAGRLLGQICSFQLAEGGISQWPAQSPALFDKNLAGGGVLLDLGAHLLDLVHWWFGQPAEIIYEDDAMGGLEANCQAELKFAQGFSGQLRLSREATFASGYSIQFEKGSIGWRLGETNSLQIEFADSDLVLSGRLNKRLAAEHLPITDKDDLTFEHCFIRQLSNVVAAVRGEQELVVPGSVGLRGLKLANQCYQKRSLMAMPWLSDSEQAAARTLNLRRQ
jgi:predicted dehydrogenase